ncbi:MAG: LysR family transcriptional regulator [Pseudomonadota bacterium]
MSRSLDRLSLLATFVRIAERGSISAAARDLGLSQASASRHLSELETRLGTVLIERTTHSLSLTEAGDSALEEARDLLNGWSSLTERFDDSSDLSGTLRVVAPIALGQRHLIDATLDWQRANPSLQINWQLDDSELNLAETGADVWIRIGRPRDDRLVVRDLVGVERLVAAHPDLVEPVATRDPRSLEQLPAVSLLPFEGNQLPLTHKNGSIVSVRANSRFVTNNIFAALNAVKKGLGYAIIPRWLIADELKAGTLIDVLSDWRAPTLTITACYLPSRRQSRALNAFLEIAHTGLLDLVDT